MTGEVLDLVHQRGGSAGIQVGAVRRFAQRPEIEDAIGVAVVMVQRDVIAQLVGEQNVAKRGQRGTACTPDQAKVASALSLQLPDHGQDRRDADAAGNEQVTRRRLQDKVVSRRFDLQGVADGSVGMKAHRAAPPVGLALDREHVMAFVGRITD
ncbi:MAG: hypothetical protein R3E68_13920 [Burkholderiaceae bacterium]